MPYVANNGVNVFYRVEPETGPAGAGADVPLLLLHGFMQRSDDWVEAGYVKTLSAGHNLVLVDARGHGNSDKPYEVAGYGMELLVGDLVLALDALDIPQIDFMGYSFGAWVGFGMAALAPERLRSLVLGGMHPYVRDPGPLNRGLSGSAGPGMPWRPAGIMPT